MRRYFVQDLPRPAQEDLPRVLVGQGQGLADQNPVGPPTKGDIELGVPEAIRGLAVAVRRVHDITSFLDAIVTSDDGWGGSTPRTEPHRTESGPTGSA